MDYIAADIDNPLTLLAAQTTNEGSHIKKISDLIETQTKYYK